MLLALCLALVSEPAAPSWPKEPTAYREVSWGARTAPELQLACANVRADVNRCKSTYKVGDVTVDDVITFTRHGMEQALFTFKVEDYRKIRASFLGRYGKPHLARTAALEGPKAAGRSGEVLTWSGPNVQIRLAQYDDTDPALGSAYFVTSTKLRRDARPRKPRR